ncbi:hypothetical protein FRC07_011109, partial [Ceratobasidium sp. 392]
PFLNSTAILPTLLKFSPPPKTHQNRRPPWQAQRPATRCSILLKLTLRQSCWAAPTASRPRPRRDLTT